MRREQNHQAAPHETSQAHTSDMGRNPDLDWQKRKEAVERYTKLAEKTGWKARVFHLNFFRAIVLHISLTSMLAAGILKALCPEVPFLDCYFTGVSAVSVSSPPPKSFLVDHILQRHIHMKNTMHKCGCGFILLLGVGRSPTHNAHMRAYEDTNINDQCKLGFQTTHRYAGKYAYFMI
jgi:hypothetical protein